MSTEVKVAAVTTAYLIAILCKESLVIQDFVTLGSDGDLLDTSRKFEG